MKPTLHDILSVRNPHPRDSNIRFFEKGHKYEILDEYEFDLSALISFENASIISKSISFKKSIDDCDREDDGVEFNLRFFLVLDEVDDVEFNLRFFDFFESIDKLLKEYPDIYNIKHL